MTPSGIEPATSRFVAQHLNHCATAVPVSHVQHYNWVALKYLDELVEVQDECCVRQRH